MGGGARVEVVAVPRNPLELNNRGELWEHLALARQDIAAGCVSEYGVATAKLREKYDL